MQQKEVFRFPKSSAVNLTMALSNRSRGPCRWARWSRTSKRWCQPGVGPVVRALHFSILRFGSPLSLAEVKLAFQSRLSCSVLGLESGWNRLKDWIFGWNAPSAKIYYYKDWNQILRILRGRSLLDPIQVSLSDSSHSIFVMLGQILGLKSRSYSAHCGGKYSTGLD